MRKLAIILCLLLLFPAPIFGQNSQPSASSADCADLSRPCMAAAKELGAARRYIKGLEAHIDAARERINIAERQIETFKEKGALETLRAAELETVIKAEREKIQILLEKIGVQEKRIEQLDKQARRARKLALITTVAAAVGIVIAVGK